MKPSVIAVLDAEGCDTARLNPEHHGKQAVRCPWHHDVNPSGSVDVTNERFCCYSCGLSDDVWGLLYKVHRLTFPEARKWLQAHDIDVDEVPGQGSPGSTVRLSSSARRAAKSGPYVPSWDTSA